MWWAAKRPQRRGKTQAERLTGESGPIGKTQVGRPGDPATRRPGDPATRLIVTTASSGFVKCSREFVSASLPFRPNSCASMLPVARSAFRTLSNMVIASPPNLSPGMSRNNAHPRRASPILLLRTICRVRQERNPMTRVGGMAQPSPPRTMRPRAAGPPAPSAPRPAASPNPVQVHPVIARDRRADDGAGWRVEPRACPGAQVTVRRFPC